MSSNKSIQFRSGLITGLIMTAARSVLLGRLSQAATTADGFPYIPTMVGIAKRDTDSAVGFALIVLDTTGNKRWIHYGGA